MKSVADDVRDEIESIIATFTPWAWNNEQLYWYLVGMVNGAQVFGKLNWLDATDIKKNYIPLALEWFAMRREVEEGRLQR